MSNPGIKAITIIFIAGLSWYSGLKFWQPLIVDQLKKDGNLRDDVYIQDTSDQPKSWEDLKKKVRNALHPDMDKENERNNTNSLIEDSKPDK